MSTETNKEFDEDAFDAMLSGSFDEESTEEVEEEVSEEEVEDTDDSVEDENDQEDTDLDDDEEEDEELDEDGDGDLDEDSEDDEVDEDEDALVEDDDLDDEDGDTEEEEEEADEADESAEDDTDDESEDDTDTEDERDGKDSETTDVVDYKAFYDAVVNAEFTANGKKVKGFADPQKIIQSQQMAAGFSEKMAGFKQYRPFMSPLKDRGMLDNQAKFDLAMNIIDGDKEAIKQHLQSLEIDPLDLDMEAISYGGKSQAATKESIVIEDVMERAKASGVEDRVRQVIGKDWDESSFQEFVGNEQVRSDLLSHIESGAYEKVQDEISEMRRIDYNGSFGNLNTIGQYRAAVASMQAKAPQEASVKSTSPETAKVVPTKASSKAKVDKVAAAKAKIVKEREEADYKKKVERKNAKAADARKKATSAIKKKPKAKPQAKFDPLKAEGQELDDLMDFLISGGR